MHLCDICENGRALYTACATANVRAAYYYDMDVVRARVRTMLAALPSNVHLLYSFKANPLPHLTALLADEGCGADISSGRELSLALRSGFAPETICFVGPGKNIEELTLAVEHNIGAVAVESACELNTLRNIATKYGRTIDVILRINPGYEIRGVRMAMGGRTTQFGIESVEALRLMRDNTAGQSPVHICGIHTYVGTRIASAEDAAWNAGQVIAQARQFGEAGLICTKVDMGGGLGIPYYVGEEGLAFDTFAAALHEKVRTYDAVGFPPCTFYLESGRYIIGPAGCFIARVRYVTMDGDTQHVEIATTPVLHGLSAGSLFAKNHRFLGGGLHSDGWKCGDIPTTACYRVHGQRMPWPIRVSAPHLSVDDYLVLLNSGAYGPTASPVWHHLEGFPEELVGEAGRVQIVGPRMTWRTLAQSQQMVAGYA